MSFESSGQNPNVGPQLDPTIGITGSSSMIQTIVGAAAVVLSILGLAGLNPLYMAAISTIAVATALVIQGVAVSTCYTHVIHETGGRHPVADFRTGMTAEFIAGATCLVLGVLAVLGVEPAVLTAASVIVLGSGVLLGAGIANRLARFVSQSTPNQPMFNQAISDALTAAAGAEVLVGGGAIVLGVIALVGTLSYTLTLIALLALGAGIVATSTAVTGKMGGIWAQY